MPWPLPVVRGVVGEVQDCSKDGEHEARSAAGFKEGPVDFTDPDTGEWPVYAAIPAKYEAPNTFGLTVEIRRGDQEHNIALTGNP